MKQNQLKLFFLSISLLSTVSMWAQDQNPTPIEGEALLPAPYLYYSYDGDSDSPAFGINPGSENFVEGTQFFYSIDYVDESLADVTDAEYLYDPQAEKPSFVMLLGPCTVTAYAKLGETSSETVVGKHFAFSHNKLKAVVGVDQSVLMPTLLPAINENDGLEVVYNNYAESLATLSDNVLTLSGSCGAGNIEASLSFNYDENFVEPYTVLNNDNMLDPIELTVVPQAPTVTPEAGSYDEPQTVTITLPGITQGNTQSLSESSSMTQIFYYLGSEMSGEVMPYSEQFTISESTVLNTWATVVTEDGLPVTTEDGTPLTSDTVRVSYVIREEPKLLFYDASVMTYIKEVTDTTITYGDDLDVQLMNSMQLDVTYTNINPNIAQVDENGKIVVTGFGTTTITANFRGNDYYKAKSVSIILNINPKQYGLKVNETVVTQSNMLNILQDNDETVSYSGQGTLILNNPVAPITVESSLGQNLMIYLKGSGNNVTSVTTTGTGEKLIIATDPTSPGKLSLANNDGKVINGFASVELQNDLKWLSGDANSAAAEIGTVIKPITDEQVIEPKGDKLDISNIPDEELVKTGDEGDKTEVINKVVDELLYTLVVKDNDGNVETIFEEEEQEDGTKKAAVMLKTQVTEEEMKEVLKKEPGTHDFAQSFNGITLKLAAGSGNIELDVDVPDGSVMHVKIGEANPTVLSNIRGIVSVPYLCKEVTFVYIYNATTPATSRSFRAKIKTAPVKMFSVGVKPNVVQPSSEPVMDLVTNKALDSDAISAAQSAIEAAGGLYEIADALASDFTSFDGEGVFDGMDVKCINLSNTKIQGVNVSRSEGPFKGVDPQTFIYLPSGNTAAAGEPNVIIGAICNNLKLDDANKLISPLQDFAVVSATLGRTFVEGQSSTVFLPFDLDKTSANALGFFYTFKEINSAGEAVLNPVTEGLVANVPYIFKKNAGGQITVNNVTVKTAKPASTALIGTYEPITWTSQMIDDAKASGDYFYGYAATDKDGVKAGEFVQVGAGAFIKPYRAYLKIHYNAARIMVGWPEESQTTGISFVGMSSADDSWYTIGGVRLSGAPVKSGLYIHQGKKTIVKISNK